MSHHPEAVLKSVVHLTVLGMEASAGKVVLLTMMLAAEGPSAFSNTAWHMLCSTCWRPSRHLASCSLTS